ncbi:MAG: MCE family protein [Gemmatimonadota bacterium]|nr:MCE family protein [Gemmatimonadota bacterium]
MADKFSEHDIRRARVGGLLILVVIGVSLAVFFLDAIVRATTEGPLITVTTRSAPGVEPGTAVWVAGRDVGRVLTVEFTEPTRGRDRVEIVAVLGRGVEDYIRADASVTIQPGALLEPVVVVIDPGTGDQPVWDVARPFTTTEEGVDVEALMEMSASLQESGDSLKAGAERLRNSVRRGGGTLAAFGNNPDVLSDAAAAMSDARDVLVRDYPTGTVARLAADTVIAHRLLRIKDRLAVLDTLDTRDRAVRSFDETSAALEAFQTRLLVLSERLDAGEGSAGRWLMDGEMARQIALLRARVDSMSVELAKAPDRWLRVKVF